MKRRADHILKMLKIDTLQNVKNDVRVHNTANSPNSSPSIIENTPSPLSAPSQINCLTPTGPTITPRQTKKPRNILRDVIDCDNNEKTISSEENEDVASKIENTTEPTISRNIPTPSPHSRTRSSSSSSSSSSSTNSSSSTSSSSSVSPDNNDNPSRRNIISKPNYMISPIHSCESDVDLSDFDPTYLSPAATPRHGLESSPPRTQSRPINIEQLGSNDGQTTRNLDSPNRRTSDTGRNLSESPTRSSPQPHLINVESAENNDEQSTTRKSKKRKRQPSLWAKNKIKLARNSGKAYTTSKSKKSVPARSIKPPCNCRLKCAENIQESQRVEIFEHYWALKDINLQRSFIKTCLMEVNPKYKYTNAARPRKPNTAFFFTVFSNRIRVCKNFFLNTLDISDRQVRTVKEKTNALGFVENDKRGTHDNRKHLDPDLVSRIKLHIEGIPRIEGHYTRSDRTDDKDYIADGKSIADLCNDFNELQESQNLSKCEYWQYLHIFNNDFNIGFFQPKKDRCETCVAYELSSGNKKLSMKENYDRHLKEKILSRQEKKKDRKNIDESHICAVYDLQAVMLCPSPKYFYYASKINCLNFTITELNKKTDGEVSQSYNNVYCYYWDEMQAQRGVNEIGSCVYDYLYNLSVKNPEKQLHVIFYSDNCAGQNKNKAMACLYAYSVSHFPNIYSITHKFLVKGHTQNEADNVHSLIGKGIKSHERSGPIYTPYQFVPIIKNARKTGQPFIVKELSHDFFKNLKLLQENWGYNFNENSNKGKLLWNNITSLLFKKEQPFIFYYNTSYTESTYETVDMRNKRKRMLPIEEIKIDNMPLYTEKLELKEKKKKDLKDLLKKNLIPNYYAPYFETL